MNWTVAYDSLPPEANLKVNWRSFGIEGDVLAEKTDQELENEEDEPKTLTWGGEIAQHTSIVVLLEFECPVTGIQALTVGSGVLVEPREFEPIQTEIQPRRFPVRRFDPILDASPELEIFTSTDPCEENVFVSAWAYPFAHGISPDSLDDEFTQGQAMMEDLATTFVAQGPNEGLWYVKDIDDLIFEVDVNTTPWPYENSNSYADGWKDIIEAAANEAGEKIIDLFSNSDPSREIEALVSSNEEALKASAVGEIFGTTDFISFVTNPVKTGGLCQGR